MSQTQSLPKWTVVKLKNLCQKTAQTTPNKQPDKPFIYVDVSSVSNEFYRIVEAKTLMGKDAPSRARKLIQTDDVIFATVRPTLRRVAIVPSELDGQVCSTGFCVLRANKKELVPDYLYFYLLTRQVAGRVELLQKGATYPAINDSDLFEQFVQLPPLSEQRAIARVMQTVQKAKEARRWEAALEREQKDVLIQHLYTYGTCGKPRKRTEIGEVPYNWHEARLEELAKEFISGGTPATKEPKFWDGFIPWTTSAPISEGDIFLRHAQRFIAQEGLENSASHLVPKDNLLIGTRVGVGKAVVNCIDVAISQDLTGIVLDSEHVDAEFVAYQFKTERIKLFFEGRKRGTTIKGISRFDLQSLKLVVPPLAEQREITGILHACDAKISALEREIELLDELFHAMLEELMTGRLSAVPLIDGEEHQ